MRSEFQSDDLKFPLVGNIEVGNIAEVRFSRLSRGFRLNESFCKELIGVCSFASCSLVLAFGLSRDLPLAVAGDVFIGFVRK